MPLPTDPMLAQQWYLNLIRVVVGQNAIWDDWTGDGVTVGIFDNGVQATHPDLNANMSAALTFEQGTVIERNHGTAVAGIVGAERDGNGIVGVAYDATMGSVNIWGNDTVGTGAGRVAAANRMVNFDIAQHSWGIVAFDYSPTSPNTLAITNAIETAITSGRSGLGTVIVSAAGNNRLVNQNFSNSGTGFQAPAGDTNTTGPVGGSRHAITVAGVGPDGWVSDYSTPGASLLVAAGARPSWTLTPNGILTTDLTGAQGYNNAGDYVDTVGTSFAAPQVSGIVALMLEANPGLGYRDVKDILAITARHTGGGIGFGSTPSGMAGNELNAWLINDADNWNGGGMHFSNDYGFGLVDAWAAVRLAESWTASARTSFNEDSRSQTIAFPVALPIENNATRTLFLTLGAGVDVETVSLTLEFFHPNPADLEIWLISPEGTRSRLLDNSGGGNDVFTWTFVSNAFRGETSGGAWQVDIVDAPPAHAFDAFIGSATLTAYGATASDHDTFFYTDEFGTLGALLFDSTRNVTDGGAGTDRVNAAAVSSASTINLVNGQTSQIAGRFVQLHNMEDAVGGDGADSITGNAGANALLGLRGNDTIDSGAGNDSIHGWLGNDSLNGGADNDYLAGGDGNDSMEGGVGNDTFVGGDGDDYFKSNIGGDVFDGGLNIDTVDYSNEFSLNVYLDGSAANTDAAAGDSFISIENLVGGFGSNIIVGTSFGNWLSGFWGNDTVRGLAGHDQLDGHEDNDSLLGGTGNDSLFGGNGHDSLEGEGDNDSLHGGAGNDVFNGGAGNDTHFGAEGNDLFRASTGFDIFDGGFDTDVVDYRTASSIRVFLDGTGTNAAAAAGDSFALIENIIGAVGNDIIVGNGVDNRLSGFDGHDTIWGRAGNDQIEGQNGHDRLYGGTGNDVLLGGAGQDVFVFADAPAAGGLDRTTDFNVADDQIEIDASAFGGGLVAGGTVQLVVGAAPSSAGFLTGVFLYNTTNGFLSYDADGGFAGAAVAFFRLQNLPLGFSAADFTVVA